MTLPIFDEEGRCPKCQFEEVKTSYCRRPEYGMACWHVEWKTPEKVIAGEHMHRTCGRCGYVWFEAPRPAPHLVVTQIVREVAAAKAEIEGKGEGKEMATKGTENTKKTKKGKGV